MGFQPSVVVPDKLFRREPSRALHESAFNLSDVDRRIQRFAGFVQYVGAKQPVFAGEQIDGDLGYRGAVSEIVEGAAAALYPVPADLGRGVEPGRGQRHAMFVSHFDGVAEFVSLVSDAEHAVRELNFVNACLVQFREQLEQTTDQFVASVFDGHSVQVGSGGGRCCGCVGHFGSVGGGKLDRLKRLAECVRRDLGNLDE